MLLTGPRPVNELVSTTCAATSCSCLLIAIPSGSFELGSGDVLMIYSDGITESLNCAGEEFGYGHLEAQLRRAVAGAGDAGAEAVLFSMLGAVQDFAAACPLVDDMSLAIIRRKAEGSRQ